MNNTEKAAQEIIDAWANSPLGRQYIALRENMSSEEFEAYMMYQTDAIAAMLCKDRPTLVYQPEKC
jgi:hypothetical protein